VYQRTTITFFAWFGAEDCIWRFSRGRTLSVKFWHLYGRECMSFEEQSLQIIAIAFWYFLFQIIPGRLVCYYCVFATRTKGMQITAFQQRRDHMIGFSTFRVADFSETEHVPERQPLRGRAPVTVIICSTPGIMGEPTWGKWEIGNRLTYKRIRNEMRAEISMKLSRQCGRISGDIFFSLEIWSWPKTKKKKNIGLKARPTESRFWKRPPTT